MRDPVLLYNRLQFAFTITFHYLFPQLTMGLALMVLYFRTRVLVSKSERFRQIARFWTRIFAITFAFGVVTGLTMEFQFGTNWANFSQFAGGIIGQTLAMEGIWAFALESIFLGVLLFGERKLGATATWFASLMIFVGTWLSGYFIIATNSWMQNPVAYTLAQDGGIHLASLGGLLTNPHILWQYLHNQTATVVTASFLIAAVGAYYLLSGQHVEHAKAFLRAGVIVAAIASAAQVFPTGDGNARMVFDMQPIKGAAMEGVFHTTDQAAMRLFGQPNMETLTIDNPVVIPNLTTLLLYRRLRGTVKGLTDFARSDWPTNVPLVYYTYHLMINLGTAFVGVMLLSLFLLWRGKLFRSRWMLWILMLAGPLPYLTTTAGWMTTEIGRQPWIVYGLLRTNEGTSPLLSDGNALFTLMAILSLYALMGLLYVFLILKEIGRGPASTKPEPALASAGQEKEA
jgi:cytochrome d ubiquinol oxidase subunit I